MTPSHEETRPWQGAGIKSGGQPDIHDSSASGPFQVLPALTDDEYAALKADIADHGVLVPVEVDTDGTILDGHHRVRACRELDINDWPQVVRDLDDDEAKRRHARRLNMARRHLTRVQKRTLIAAEITTDPDRSDRAIGRLLGVDHKTVGSVRRELAGETPHDYDEPIPASLNVALDAHEFAVLYALSNRIAVATVVGWLTMAQHRLNALTDSNLVEYVRRRVRGMVMYLVEHGEDVGRGLAGPDVCFKPLTDEEVDGLGRAIAGRALLDEVES